MGQSIVWLLLLALLDDATPATKPSRDVAATGWCTTTRSEGYAKAEAQQDCRERMRSICGERGFGGDLVVGWYEEPVCTEQHVDHEDWRTCSVTCTGFCADPD